MTISKRTFTTLRLVYYSVWLLGAGALEGALVFFKQNWVKQVINWMSWCPGKPEFCIMVSKKREQVTYVTKTKADDWTL